MQEEIRALDWRGRQGLTGSQLHRVDDCIDLGSPELEKPVDAGIGRGEVEGLPDEALQERWMVRQIVEHFRCGETPTAKAQRELVRLHLPLHRQATTQRTR